MPLNKHFIKSFMYAARGLKNVFFEERNFRIQLGGTLFVFIGMGVFRLTLGEDATLTLVIMLVLVLELINSAMERFVDMTSPRYHTQAQAVKDIMAAAVLVASGGALLVGIFIFMPHVLNW